MYPVHSDYGRRVRHKGAPPIYGTLQDITRGIAIVKWDTGSLSALPEDRIEFTED